MKGDVIKAPNLLLYQLLLAALVFICLLIHVWYPHDSCHPSTTSLPPDTPRRKRSKDPKPFTGLIHKPLCEACEQRADGRPTAPGSPPPVIPFTRGRRRTVDTQAHFCPDPDCSYHGWLGRGNVRANGHPGGQAWRQLPCVSCHGYFSETHGTIFHGKHDPLTHQSGSKQKRDHQRERDFWLACAEGLLGNACDTLNVLVVEKLDSIVRASSLVEMVNALMRPYLNSCKGQITQGA